MMIKNTVLIAHYNKDISWVKEINPGVDVKIYSTSDPSKVFIQPNKGMDANMYLRYIIDNYDNLPERTLFCHHHKTDWTQDFDLPHIINNLNWEHANFINIGARKNYGDVFIIDPRTKQWLRDVWFLFERHIPYPKKLFYVAGTQFMCHRDLIKQYPKYYWQSLYSWLMTTEMPDWLSGRVFEWVWAYLLTKDPIDTLYKNKEFLKNI